MKNGYIWGAVIVVVLIGGIVLFRANKAAAPSPTASSTSMGTTTVDLGNGVVATLPPGVTITQTSVPVSGGIKAPSLTQPVTYAVGLAPDAVITLKTNIATLRASLQTNPAQGDTWLQLAIYYKSAGDYMLAEQVWLYLTKAAPTSYVAFANLGDLYTNYLKNNAKAEANYKQAITLKPDYVDNYRNLYYLYLSEGNTTAAAAIVAQGLKANPNNPDLLDLQKQTK